MVMLVTRDWISSDMVPFLALVICSDEFSSQVFFVYKLIILGMY